MGSMAPSPVPQASVVADRSKVSKPEPAEEVKAVGEKEKIVESSGVDFTKLPGMLDQNFEKYDLDSALHSTILSTGNKWTKKYQTALLSPLTTLAMNTDQQKEHRNTAFDLLDALSRSGVLDVDEAEFHVVLAATHCFDETLMNTLIQKNVNPIEKLERSMLIFASTINNISPEELVRPEFLPTIKYTTPNLFE